MSDKIDTNSEADGYGATMEIKLPNGTIKHVPWGFSDGKKEANAAKKHKIENPGTAVKAEVSGGNEGGQ